MTEKLKPNGEPYKTSWYTPVEEDKRKENGNNNTSRGGDVKKRKRRTGYYVLKDEVVAGLAARTDMIIEHFGGAYKMAKTLHIKYPNILKWRTFGRISPEGARKIHQYHIRSGKGFTARFCRFDLEFDRNGRAKSNTCQKREMLRVVK